MGDHTFIDRSGRARRWDGRHSKWVFAGNRYTCPLCGDDHGGTSEMEVVGERVCVAHGPDEFVHLPKKLWHSRYQKGWTKAEVVELAEKIRREMEQRCKDRGGPIPIKEADEIAAEVEARE